MFDVLFVAFYALSQKNTLAYMQGGGTGYIISCLYSLSI